MIQTIELTNIKSHLATTLNLSPGLNVIAGESDEGKSMIFRAVRWVFENRPIGWNPKPWAQLKPKGKESSVTITFTDGNVVKRVRTFSGKNWYVLNGEKLEGLKKGVPDQVTKVINVNESNLQQQRDMFFLLNETPGAVAKEINKVFELDKMANGLANAKSRLRDAEVLKAEAEAKIKDKQQQIKDLTWAQAAGQRIKELVNIKETLNRDWQLQTNLRMFADNYWQTKSELAACSENISLDYEGMKRDMDAIERARKKLIRTQKALEVTHEIGLALAGTLPDADAVIAGLDILRGKHAKFGELVTETHRTLGVLKQIKEANNDMAGQLPDECLERMANIATQLGDISKLRIYIRTLDGFTGNQRELDERIKELEAQIHSATDALETVRGKMEVCPICQSELKKE